ncbi:unnamed protein product, partial [Ectocarpus sp. 8 AP-2014]
RGLNSNVHITTAQCKRSMCVALLASTCFWCETLSKSCRTTKPSFNTLTEQHRRAAEGEDYTITHPEQQKTSNPMVQASINMLSKNLNVDNYVSERILLVNSRK